MALALVKPATMSLSVPISWRPLLARVIQSERFRSLDAWVAAERRAHVVLPAATQIFRALEVTPPEAVKVLLLGQDPYPTPGHAHGLCFSVQPQVRPLPGSLRNIYKELASDVPGFRAPAHGFLESWALQGILMLNTVLTVRAGEANSHQQRGWEEFTDEIIRELNRRTTPVVFVLWGRQAQRKLALISTPPHRVVATAHPSPLSARHFLGSRPFSQINQHLTATGQVPIDWNSVNH